MAVGSGQSIRALRIAEFGLKTRIGRLLSAMVILLGTAALSVVVGTTVSSAPAGASSAVTPTIWTVDTSSSTLLAHPLSATGNATPAVTISSNGTNLNRPFGTEAFDAHGDMWIANLGSPATLVEFTSGQLAASGDPTPAVTISSNAGSLNATGSVAFDRSGDLWALNENGNTVVEFTPSQLASSGSPTPAVTISGLARPYGFAFDSSGDLWVTNRDAVTVVEYTPSQLAASGSPTPAVTLSPDASSSLSDPTGVAFDASGDLWVTNANTSSLVEYTPSQLSISGDPTPAVTISSNGTSLNGPFSLAFDAAGDLWVPNAYAPDLEVYTPSQLAASGHPTPANTISGAATGLSEPGGVVIEQAPTVTSIAPIGGPPTGGTTVTVHGTGFNYGSGVDFGSSPATSVTYVSPYELKAVAPAGIGIVNITVSTFAGTSATSAADQFIYTASGYWEVASDGGIFSFNVPFHGSAGALTLNKPIVGMAATPDRGGYWLVASDGGIFSYGDAAFHGSAGALTLNKPVVGMTATPDGGGYWLVASDGGIFSYGDAAFHGSAGALTLNKPVVGMAATPDGGGYWLVASDGGIFSYGDATFHGSAGALALNKPVVGMAATPDGGGYWLVATDGGIFSYGDAVFHGSTGALTLNRPIVGMAATLDGYWLVASDGGVFAFGVPFVGSMGGKPLNAPIVGMAGG